MDTALPQKFPFILDRSISGLHVLWYSSPWVDIMVRKHRIKEVLHKERFGNHNWHHQFLKNNVNSGGKNNVNSGGIWYEVANTGMIKKR